IADLTIIEESRREAEARRIAKEEAERGFDLSRGPVLRARLIRLSEQEHVLVIGMHHIVSDGWSIGVMGEEISGLYESVLRGEPAGLRELKAQYADYASWQRDRLSGEVLEEQVRHWRRRMAGAPEVMRIGVEKARPAERSNRGGVERMRIGED